MDPIGIQTIKVDLAKKSLIQDSRDKSVPTFVQGDTNRIIFDLYENGVAADLSKVGRAIANFKSGSNVYSQIATVEGSTVIYNLGANESATVGVADVELQLYNADNTKRVSTMRVKIYLSPAIGEGEISSGNPTYTDLQTLFIEVDEVKTTATDAGAYATAQGDYAKAQGDAVDTKVTAEVTAQVPVAVDEKVGQLASLQTEDKTSVVGAVNEVTEQLAEKAYFSSATYIAVQKLHHGNEDVDIAVLGDSTGNDVTDWVYLMAQKLGELYPSYTVKYNLWDDATYSYKLPETIHTGSGTQTLNIWNSSVPGKHLYYPIQHKFKAQVVAPNPDLIIISHGHNEGTLSNDLAELNNKTRYYLLTQYVSQAVPTASIMLIAQNPQIGNNVQKKRVTMTAEIASRCGYGFVNVHDAFLQTPDWETTLMGDSVHPNAEGSKIWVNEVMKYFNYSLGMGPLSQPASSFNTAVDNLLINGDFRTFDGVAAPANWTVINAPTFSKDTTKYETKGYGVKMVTAASSSGFIYQTVTAVNTNFPLDFYKGKYVTLSARLRKPTGQPNTTGRVALYDGTQTMTSSLIYDGDGEYYWDCAAIKVAENATTLRAYIYADSSSNGNMEVTVDRAILAFDVLPRDII